LGFGDLWLVAPFGRGIFASAIAKVGHCTLTLRREQPLHRAEDGAVAPAA
jgi:hypothetical protein